MTSKKWAAGTIVIMVVISMMAIVIVSEYEPPEYSIAIVRPVFSETAFTDSFYPFFRTHANATAGQYITSDLGLLNRSVVDDKSDWMWSDGIRNTIAQFNGTFSQVVYNANITYLSDIDVDAGCDLSRYDLIIVGFEEYVTLREYNALRRYVLAGGHLLVNDACTFLCEVAYRNGYVWLVNGKGWAFNGTAAWRSVYHRWAQNNTSWLGSNFRYFKYGTEQWAFTANNSLEMMQSFSTLYSDNYSSLYMGHEENYVSNFTATTILGIWHDPLSNDGRLIAEYEHTFGKGKVLHMGIMNSETMYRDLGLMRLFIDAIRYLLTGHAGYWQFPEGACIQARYPEGTP